MRMTKAKVYGLARTAMLISFAAATGCVDADSPLINEGAQGCDEFQPGGEVPSDLAVDGDVRVFLQASADFSGEAVAIRDSVLTACAAVALDLGASDTWSSIEDIDARVSNGDGTGACDAAAAKVEAILVHATEVQANVAIAISRGQCHMDFEAQTACDRQCTTDTQCDPGSVETRCEPGSLRVVCDAACAADATCCGTPDLPANCMGKCESECQGECKGDCTSADGTRTTDDPNCRGKCSASCNGTCRGLCKVEAPEGVQCGANVACQAGCSGSFTAPECTTEFTPPQCTVREDCHQSCSAQVVAHSVCDPCTVKVFANVTVSADLQPLITTLEINLPPLIAAAELHGKLLFNAGQRLATSGQSLSGRVGDLDGKSLACAAAASTGCASGIGSLDVSIQASARIQGTLTTNAQ
jgi:hypothetical protein